MASAHASGLGAVQALWLGALQQQWDREGNSDLLQSTSSHSQKDLSSICFMRCIRAQRPLTIANKHHLQHICAMTIEQHA